MWQRVVGRVVAGDGWQSDGTRVAPPAGARHLRFGEQPNERLRDVQHRESCRQHARTVARERNLIADGAVGGGKHARQRHQRHEPTVDAVDGVADGAAPFREFARHTRPRGAVLVKCEPEGIIPAVHRGGAGWRVEEAPSDQGVGAGVGRGVWGRGEVAPQAATSVWSAGRHERSDPPALKGLGILGAEKDAHGRQLAAVT